MQINFSDPAIVGSIITVMGCGLCALLGWLLKSAWDDIKRRVTTMEQTHDRCFNSLPNVFANKTQTEEKIRTVDIRLDAHGIRLDEHGERIVRVEGKVGL